MKRVLTIPLPATMAAAGFTIFCWFRLFHGLLFDGTLQKSVMCYQPAVGTFFLTKSIPPYTIYFGAFIAIGFSFLLLRRSFVNAPVRYGLCFFLLTFLISQCIGGFLFSYFLDSWTGLVFEKDCLSISSIDRLIYSLKGLPIWTLVSLTFGIIPTIGLCPAVGLSAAVVATSLRGRQQTQQVQEVGAYIVRVMRIVAAMFAGLICCMLAVFAVAGIFGALGPTLGIISLLMFVVVGGLTLLLIKR